MCRDVSKASTLVRGFSLLQADNLIDSGAARPIARSMTLAMSLHPDVRPLFIKLMSYRLARSLKKLRDQINEKFPLRSKVSDGWIGDLAHASRRSDHNPNGVGVVCAVDITHDPVFGPDCNQLAAQLFNAQDPRLKYLIWNRRITTKDKTGWKSYNGANAHSHHLHISVHGNYDNMDAWILDDAVKPPPPTGPLLKRGSKGSLVVQLQKRLISLGYKIKADGDYGSATMQAVMDFQKANNLSADGVVGDATRRALNAKVL